MLTDLRFAIRQLSKNPGFTAIAVLSLALGIGATTAVFSLLNGTLLRPLPYAAANGLVFVSPEKLDRTAFSDSANGAQVAAWREAKSFRGVAPYHWTFNFLIPDGGTEGPGSESIEGIQDTHELFSVLGVAPLLGRTFTPEEKEVKDHPVVVLGYHLWQRQFAGDPAIVGKTIRISRLPPLTVIGVMPPRLRFLPSRGAAQEPNYNLHAYVDYWLPNAPNPANTNGRYWSVVARLCAWLATPPLNKPFVPARSRKSRPRPFSVVSGFIRGESPLPTLRRARNGSSVSKVFPRLRFVFPRRHGARNRERI